MISRLIPNTAIYFFNYIKYLILYKNSWVSPRSFLYKVELGKKNMICGGNYMDNCRIGDYTYVSGNDGGGIVSGYQNVTIGKYCSISTNVEIITASSHHKEFVSTFPFYSMPNSFSYNKKKSGEFIVTSPVIIGNDVWIGSNVTILPRVTVHDGAIVGAGSVVVQDVESYSIVAGCPAKTIGYRFDKETIERLLEMKWWNWPEKKIRANLSLIMSEKVKEFIENER